MLLINLPQAQQNVPAGSAYSKSEADAAWLCLQKEVQKLLTELLQQGGAMQARAFQANGRTLITQVVHRNISTHCLVSAWLGRALVSIKHA